MANVVLIKKTIRANVSISTHACQRAMKNRKNAFKDNVIIKMSVCRLVTQKLKNAPLVPALAWMNAIRPARTTKSVGLVYANL